MGNPHDDDDDDDKAHEHASYLSYSLFLSLYIAFFYTRLVFLRS